MSSVDDRIVNMQFNNKQFQSAATESQKTLEGLERTIANTGNSKGLSAMASGVEQVSSRFSALQVAGVTAIATIANKAVNMGLDLAKSFTIEPLTAGFQEYETNLKSVQTIMANTGEKIGIVNKYLNDLNHYSDQTIYNFSQMADSIGKFTAAGVKLPAATDAIKGMANTAALTGASSMQLNSAMYQMSQALASGTIKLMDWNSLVNANMGTKNIQKALMATNRTLGDNGVAMDKAIDTYGTFRDSLQTGWLTAETFTKTMKVMAGQTKKNGDTVAFTVEQLQKMGYAKEAAVELNRLSAASIESATKIKTFTQLLDVAKESVGSGFGQMFMNLFGNLKEAGTLWTKVGNIVTGAIGDVFAAVNGTLLSWKELGGYTAMWNGFGNIFKAIGNLLHPFVAAFQAVMPATGEAGKGLADFSKGFESFTAVIEKFTRGAEVITPVLVFMAKGIKAGFGALGGVLGYIKTAVSSLGDLKGAIQSLSLSDLTFGNLLKLGGSIVEQAKELGVNIVKGVAQGLGMSGSELVAAVSTMAMSVIETFKDVLGIHSPAAEMVPLGINVVQGVAQGIVAAASFIWDAIVGLGSIIAGAFDQLFGGMDAFDWATLMNTIFTGALILAVTNFTKNSGGLLASITGFFDGIGDALGNFTEALGTQAKAELIRSYAIAIGVLAASLLVLSFLDVDALAKSLGAMSIMLTLLVGSLKALTSMKVADEAPNLLVMSAAIVLISMAMLNLAAAVAILGHQDPATLAKGLGAMAISLGIMLGAMFAFSKIQGSIAGMAASMLVMAFAMNALATAILAFGLMDFGMLTQGFGAMAVGLGLMVAAMLGMDKMKGSVEGLAASIFVMSAAMVVMATAVGMLGLMDMGTLARGVTFMAIGLGIMVGALLLLSGNTAGVLAGAGAMLMMAAAMNMLVGVILILGAAPWETVAKGLGFVAAALAIFLLAGLGAMYVAPGLLALGVSLGLIGAGLFLAGAGMLAFSTGFALLAATGVAGVAVLVVALQAFLALLPSFGIQIAAAFVVFIETIAKAAPRIRAAFSKIFKEMIGVVRDAIPEIQALIADLIEAIFKTVRGAIPQYGRIIQTLIETGITVIRNLVPQVVAAAVEIALAIMRGIEQKIPEIAHTAVDMILALLNAIAEEYPRLLDGAAKAIVKFINGLSTAIDNNAGAIQTAAMKLVMSFANAVTGGLAGKATSLIGGAISNLADNIPNPFKALGKMVAGGLKDDFVTQVTIAVEAALKMANAIIAAGSEEVAKLQEQARKKEGEAYTAQANADIQARFSRQEDNKSDKKDRVADQKQREADKAQRIADRAADKAEKAKKQHAENAKHLAELAEKYDKASDKAKEAAKAAEKAAKQQEKAADKQSKAADKAAKAADKAAKAASVAAAKVQYQKDFEAADLWGKYDMKQDEATSAASDAQRLLAEANAKAAQGNAMLKDKDKKNDAEAQRLLDQAADLTQKANAAAARAQAANASAQDYYRQAKAEEAQAVYARIGDIEAERLAQEQERKDAAEFEAADMQGKIDIMTKRAEANQARAKAAAQWAQAAIDQARALAATDAKKAMALLDSAEKLAAESEAAADKAEQEKDQAQQLRKQLEDEAKTKASSSGSGTGSSISPSRAILEDAARSVDRYTASLMQAEALARTAEAPIQFVQNNTSPTALTPSEVYRQTKNLLSGAEIKMGVTN